jgi:hypothetical protein
VPTASLPPSASPIPAPVDSGLGAGAIAGIVISISIVVCVIGFAVWWKCRHHGEAVWTYDRIPDGKAPNGEWQDGGGEYL